MFVAITIGLGATLLLVLNMDLIRDFGRVVLFGSRNETDKSKPAFDPARSIPSLAGKVILITGAAGDLGRQTAVDLARYGRPARIYIADLPSDDDSRQALSQRIMNEAYGDVEPDASSNAQRTVIKFLDLDLSSFASIQACATAFLALEDRLDVLILNAGVLRVIPALTVEGYEVHFGVNYLGHALLSRLLKPLLLSTAQKPDADVRVVVVSSEGHHAAPKGGIDFTKVETECADLHYIKRYGQSKVALIGLMKTLSRDHPELTVVAIHPGRIFTAMATSLGKDSALARWTQPIAPLFCVPLNKGVLNHLWAATSQEVVSGNYYEPVGCLGTLSSAAKDETLVGELRTWTNGVLDRAIR